MKITRIPSGMSNCWLVQWSGRTLLIDAGTAADRGFAARLSRCVDPRSIELLALTHGHWDHVGHAEELRRRFGIPIALDAGDFPLVEAASLAHPPARGAFSELVRRQTLRMESKNAYPPFTPDFVLPDGLPPSVRRFFCPGHTAGCSAFLIDGCLFAGDAVMGLVRPDAPWYADDFARAGQSLGSLAQVSCHTVYPGHGRPFAASQLQRLSSRLREKL